MGQLEAKLVCDKISNGRINDINIDDLQGDKVIKNGEVLAEGCKLERPRNKR